MKKKITATIALILSFLLTSVTVYAAYPEIDRESPYSGDVIMASNITSIGSDDTLIGSNQLTGFSEVETDESISSISLTSLTSGEQWHPCGSMYLEQISAKNNNSQTLLRSSSEQSAVGGTEYNVGDTRYIESRYMKKDEPSYDSTITAKLIAKGEKCTVWWDTDVEEISSEDALNLAAKLDEIIKTINQYFGDNSSVDVDGDGRVAVVYCPMYYVGGYFWAADLLDDYNNNYMDMIHINTCYSNRNFLHPNKSVHTFAHEFQHRINYAQTNGQYESWLNESFAQSAVAVAGLADNHTISSASKLSTQLNFTCPFIFEKKYVPGLTNSNVGDYSSNVYTQWYLFGRYIAHQTEGYEGGGNEIFKTILQALKVNGKYSCTKDSLIQGLKNIGYMGTGENAKVADFQELITNYNAALLLREDSGVFSLNGNTRDEKNPDNDTVDGVWLHKVNVSETPVTSLVGGGAACWFYSSGTKNGGTPDITPGENIILAGIDTDPTVTEPATTAPVTDELKVTASSNIFPTATKAFNKEEGTITVSYKLTSSMDVVDTQWKLTYDNTKLEYKASDNMSGGVQTITPSAGNKLVYRNVNNYIKGNFSTLNLVPFETNADFVSVTFNIIGTGEAEIYLDLEILSLGYVDSSDNFNHASIVDYSQMQDISGIKGFENASISTLTTLDSNISIMLGDVNGDGYVKIDDVTLILKYAVSMQSLNALQIKAADVDMDGIVNVRDATLIQKYINEIITAF